MVSLSNHVSFLQHCSCQVHAVQHLICSSTTADGSHMVPVERRWSTESLVVVSSLMEFVLEIILRSEEQSSVDSNGSVFKGGSVWLVVANDGQQ